MSVPLGSLYYVLAFLLLVGTTNAVNLTDGLDGLAASVTVPVTLAYAYIAYQSGSMDLSIFALTLTGACLGFYCSIVIRLKFLWAIQVLWHWAEELLRWPC